jgi:O-antigen/teichoic acid export membrane protein
VRGVGCTMRCSIRAPMGASTEADEPVAVGAAPPNRILANAGFRAIADIGSKLATMALFLTVARKAGTTQFGIFAFAISFGGIAVTLGQFGQEFVLVREVARDRRRLDELYSDVLVSRFALGLPPLLVSLAIAYALGLSGRTALVVLLMGLGFIGEYVVQVSFAVFQAFERVSLMPVVLITQRWLTTITAITVLYLGGGIVAVAAIYCGGAALAACMSEWLLYRKVAQPKLRVRLRGALAVTRAGVPVGLGMVALTLLSRIDMSMLAAFKRSAQVGEYGAAYRLLEATGFVTWAVNIAVLPTMARLTPSTVPAVGAVFQRAVKLVLAMTLPAAVGAAILAPALISLLYGAPYARSAGALTLLAATITLAPVSALSSQLLYAQGAKWVVGVTYAAVFVENMIVNLMLIPRYSLDGAAAGTSISEVLVSGTLLYCSRRLRGPVEIRRLLAGTVSGTIVAAAIMALLRDELAAALPAAIVAYLVVFLAYERVAFPSDFGVLQAFARRLLRRAQGGPPAGPSPAR